MLAHLTQDCTDIQVDVARIRHLKALFYCVAAEVQVVIFDLQGLFEVGQSRPELLSATENARKVVVSDSSVSVTLLCEHLSLAEQFQRHIKVLYKKSEKFIRYLPF